MSVSTYTRDLSQRWLNTFVVLVARSSPVVSNLLGLDVAGSEWWAVQWWSWDLKNGQRRNDARKSFRHSRNGWNQRGEAGI
jgi:hypothetical protein